MLQFVSADGTNWSQLLLGPNDMTVYMCALKLFYGVYCYCMYIDIYITYMDFMDVLYANPTGN